MGKRVASVEVLDLVRVYQGLFPRLERKEVEELVRKWSSKGHWKLNEEMMKVEDSKPRLWVVGK